MARSTTLPLCYRFYFNIETMVLSLAIQKWLVPEIQKVLSEGSPLMKYLYNTYGGDSSLFTSFGEKKSFGYCNSIRFLSETETEIVYGFTLTPIIRPTEEVCDNCEGSRIDYFNHDCYLCRSTGRKHIQSSTHFSDGMLSLYPIIKIANATLFSIFAKKDVDTYDQQIKTDEKQLVAIEWSDTSGMHNCYVTAWLDDSVYDWVRNASDVVLQQMTDAMSKAEEVLLRKEPDRFSRLSFRFSFDGDDKKSFTFQVPGNACTLGTDSHVMGMFSGLGKTLSPHNVDTRFQQMYFIVGLAVLSGLVAKIT